MTPEILKIIATLGVPGLALYVFYLLLQKLDFKFESIPPILSAIIVILFLLIVGFITYKALSLFTQRIEEGVFHVGEIQNLALHLDQDLAAPFTIKFEGDDTAALKKLYFDLTKAADYSGLLDKLCSAKSACVACQLSGGPPPVMSIKQTAPIAPNCKVDGRAVYCCA